MDESSVYFKILHKETIPSPIRKLIVIGSSWAFQSIFHVDRTELLFKLVLELLFLGVVSYTLSTVLQLHMGWTILLGFLIAHTMNYLFNGQFFVALKNAGLSHVSHTKFKNFALQLEQRVCSQDSILAGMMIGSISRGKLTATSDLDVRILRKRGIVNGLKVSVFLLLEHSRALASAFPLDIYVADNVEWFRKKVKNDVPIILYDPENILSTEYIRTTRFSDVLGKDGEGT
ncbi:hypothetical protein CL673_07650 [Candidatus Bathyarchaeota archaeon]|nr:hypothetical protein [Nitrososphaerota archaeon]MBQ04559.1 hypothetical protein [Candidatus Bathyarchaeota archaeon]|tara:strand:+ start:1699 stop:2391 length:693 start_codon:yes stop_codon:yes gene_type:complete